MNALLDRVGPVPSTFGLVLQCADAAAAKALARELGHSPAIDVGEPLGADLPVAFETDLGPDAVSAQLSALPGVVAVHLAFAARNGGPS